MKLLIYGIGKFAEWIQYEFTNDSPYEVEAFCVQQKFYKEKTFNNLPVFEFETIEVNFPPNEFCLFIAVGLNNERERIFKLAKEKGYLLVSYISKNAITSNDLKYGENTFVSSGSRVSSLVSIGNNSIIIAATVAHHCKIGNNCLISASTLGGNVEIGDNSFVGMNVAIQQNVKVGQKNIIGMGCMITTSTDDNQVYDVTKYTKLRSITTDQFEKKYLK